jgi:hypothetical protein
MTSEIGNLKSGFNIEESWSITDFCSVIPKHIEHYFCTSEFPLSAPPMNRAKYFFPKAF